MNKLALSHDSIGIIASSLCMIHCIGTPFLFIAKACSTACCADTPLWWQAIDYVFLFISFIAIYYTTKNTSNKWIAPSLWLSWFILSLTILNHSFQLINLPNNFIYFPAALIIVLHFYNLKYCNCQEKECCTMS